jgi:hypothetical protein
LAGRGFSPSDRVVREARWIRNQVWTEGDVRDASSFVFPRSYDVTSGYGFLGTDYFSWMLDHNDAYREYDRTHDDHRLDVPKDSSDDAAIERVMMAWGANAYDMASWSIALSAAVRSQWFSRDEKSDFTAALAGYHRFLLTSFYPGGFQSYRAGGAGWQYGESAVDAASGADPRGRAYDARNAYYWAYPAPRWQNPDPHWDPQAPPGAVMDWPGWDAVTGEEAWAALIGPMQAAWNQGRGRPGWAAARAPLDALALVGNACRALRALDLMRNSATGAVYRNVRHPGSPDQAKGFDVSVENNWSLYTGLRFLRSALEDLRASLPGHRHALDFDLDQSLADATRIQQGLAGFFRTKALVWHDPGQPFGDPAAVDHGFFLQGTHGRAGDARGNTDAFATDVQMSGEWTWGAINAAIVLADFYREPAHADPARAGELLDTARAMIAGVDRYCSHDYNPDRLPSGRDWVGYLYADDRQWIPWGWYSNPCPSQAATTWALRVSCGFDSFELGGGDHQDTVRSLGLAGGLDR